MKGKRYGNISPQFLVSTAEPLEDVVRRLEDQMLMNVARLFRASPDDWQSPSLQWQARKMAQLGVLRADNIQAIARIAGDENAMVELALERTLRKALKAIDPALADALHKGYLQGNPSGMDDAVNRQLTTYARQAADKLNMVNTVMLNSSLEQYSRIISNTLAYERALGRAQQTLNARTAEVVTGVSTRQQALRRAVTDMARDGLTGFIDAGGHHWSPEAYVSMDIRTTVHNVATQATMDRCREYGNNIIEVSSHAGARPLCEPYQGRLFDLDDGSGTVEDGAGNRIPYAPWSSTSYGEPGGLLGINCGHFIFPFVPGYSVKTYSPTADKERNEEEYQQSQQQRKLERMIRTAKREEGLLRAAGDAEAADKAHQRVLTSQAAMRTFIEDTGRTRRRDREQVYGQ